MPRTEALVPTDRPARYGKQLVAHLGRRAGGEWDEQAERGWIEFAAGRAEVEATADGLRMTVDGDDLDQLEDVVGRHLVRFGTRDELHVRWVRADGSAGTEQQAPAEDAQAE